MLRGLARRAMALAETVQEQAADRAAREKQDGIERADLTLAFSRAARTVRLTLTLAAKLDEARRKDDRDQAAERERRAEATAAQRLERDRQRVERIVQDAIESNESLTDVEAEDVMAEFDGRIESPEIEDVLGQIPHEDLAARLMRDIEKTMGLTAPIDCRVTAVAWNAAAAAQTSSATSPDPNDQPPAAARPQFDGSG
jgi:hypothetical protein